MDVSDNYCNFANEQRSFTLATYYGNVRQLDRIADCSRAERHSPEGLFGCAAFQGKRYIKIEKAGYKGKALNQQ